MKGDILITIGMAAYARMTAILLLFALFVKACYPWAQTFKTSNI
jgi:hypothetical protein